MGRAYTGLADDISSIFLNPSGIASMEGLSLTSMRATLINEINYTVLGAAVPLPLGSAGLGYINSSIPSIPLTRWVDNSGVLRPEVYGSSDYSSNLFLVSYAVPAEKLLRQERLKNLDLGATLKLFSQGFSSSVSGTMDGSSGSGMDLDLGIKYRFQKWLSAGAVLNNILPAGMGGRFVWAKNNTQEEIPAAFKLGAALRLLGQDGLRRTGSHELLLALDAEKGLSSGGPMLVHAGLEWKPAEPLAIRAGLDQQSSGAGIETNFTCGIGIKALNFTFDYAYHQYGDLTENTTHYFSIGYSMPKRSHKAPGVGTSEQCSVDRFPLKVKLKEFPDVPKDSWASEPVRCLATLGVLLGYADGTFGPDKPVSKAEFVSMIVRSKWGEEAKPVSAEVYVDVPADHWASRYIALASKKGIISKETKNFYPDKQITRAEAVVIAVKFSNLIYFPMVFVKPYEDVPQGYWAARQIAAAKGGGYLSFIKEQKFEPDKPLTRAEAAFILSKTDFFEEEIEGLFQ